MIPPPQKKKKKKKGGWCFFKEKNLVLSSLSFYLWMWLALFMALIALVLSYIHIRKANDVNNDALENEDEKDSSPDDGYDAQDTKKGFKIPLINVGNYHNPNESVPSSSIALPTRDSRAKRSVKLMILYPIILLVCWTPPTIRRIWAFYYSDPSFVITFFRSLTSSIGGLCNAVAFFVVSKHFFKSTALQTH
ncbi:hypothetical protein RFI_01229 [Reticulomyxa filosa]|uniref:G protein-coupled receptor GPR1/2/3 C-terminal domain-containing protein n=1 Tax=Reticulomyxa filosa TaxID=46433 RepID=X6PCD7_RETFI|nr:hypothetical protein RFI_01229 [Reticulomyxa filosa]|eukprot:ETO35836.1 hypothetical protein RFI_01229 [Reticulomyxa filosa]